MTNVTVDRRRVHAEDFPDRRARAADQNLDLKIFWKLEENARAARAAALDATETSRVARQELQRLQLTWDGYVAHVNPNKRELVATLLDPTADRNLREEAQLRVSGRFPAGLAEQLVRQRKKTELLKPSEEQIEQQQRIGALIHNLAVFLRERDLIEGE